MDRKGADYDKVIAELQNNLKVPTLTLTHVYQENDGNISIMPSNMSEIIEELAMVDDEVLEKYINDQDIDGQWLASKMISLTHKNQIFPIIGGSALIDVGINDLVDSIARYLPVTSKKLEEEMSAYVFMIRVDENGKNAYIKVLNGSINNRDIISTGGEKLERIKNIMISDGAKMKSVDTVYSGDIAVVNGLDVKCGQIIGNNVGLKNI